MKKIVRLIVDSKKVVSQHDTNNNTEKECAGCYFESDYLDNYAVKCSKYVQTIDGFTFGPSCSKNESIFILEKTPDKNEDSDSISFTVVGHQYREYYGDFEDSGWSRWKFMLESELDYYIKISKKIPNKFEIRPVYAKV